MDICLNSDIQFSESKRNGIGDNLFPHYPRDVVEKGWVFVAGFLPEEYTEVGIPRIIET
jgi:hypothetical protein